jgi:nitrite reductase (NADH) large subunit
LVVVGNGMVGQRFVDAIYERDLDGGWQVTVLGAEHRAAYDRVALSSYFEGAAADDLELPTSGCYEDSRYVRRLAEPVTAIARSEQTVTTAAGRVLDYDHLVIATGSIPFVPPVSGSDLPGCFVYRTLDDLDAIRDAAIAAQSRRGRAAGLVVGGGLLGLEAARALRLLGLSPHVVELAPWLMPMQVDEGGGALLGELVAALDVRLHLGTSMQEIAADGDRLLATLGSGLQLDLDLIVFAAGIRPNDALGRAAGLSIGRRGGIEVDSRCLTADPAISAIGECAAVDGVVHGLVAPGNAMADVVANRLLGRDGALGPVDTSSKLKLLGVDVASFGDAHATTPGALEIVLSNPIARSYSKLVVSDDARTVLGGVLVGDASRYAALRPLVGREVPGDPAALIAPAGELDPGALPDDAQVCSCAAVTAATIRSAIVEDGKTTVGELKECTKAGTNCGSCVPLLKSLLTKSGVSISPALCEHFAYSRAQLFDVVRVTEIRSFSQLVARYGTGRGCDICKPVVASILASLGTGHVLDGEQAGLQDTNDHFLANLQKNGTYSVVPRIPGGEITPQKLMVIAQVATDFGLYTKITGGQRIDLFGARVEQLPLIWRRLVDAGFESGHAYGKALRTVKSCVGSTWCRFGVQDSVSLAIELELRYRGLRAPHKVKAGVSGCARECAEAQSKDVGVIATENGWNLFVGGNGGFRPRHADLFLVDVDTETLIRTIDRFLIYYVRTADRLQRTAGWVESFEGGLDRLRAVIVDDELGICADLDAAMAQHVTDYQDEWAGVLADPDRLRRFVSFVNAPDVPDPTIAFVERRGQIQPVDLAGPVLEVVG